MAPSYRSALTCHERAPLVGEQMSSRSILFSIAAILLTGCAASTTGQVRGTGTDCPMNTKPYCQVSRHRAEAPDWQHCRCVRHSDINDMLGGDY